MSDYTGLEIAVVGIACQFPSAKNKDEFWKLLESEKEGIAHLTKEELIERGVPESSIEDPRFVGVDGYLSEKEYFDNHFFKFTPHDAKVLDPQFRTFFKTAWNALEDAAIVPEKFDKKIGIYMGARDNPIWQAYSHALNTEGRVDGFAMGHYNNKEFIASLLAYKLNLKGPAVYLSSACSTSLVALHHAYRALLLGDADVCLAGGVSVAPSLKPGYFYQEGMIMSDDGSCKPFSKDSNGTTGGEGSGVVVLKRLKDALASNDHIYAVVKGTAINNDGNQKVGYTAPSIEGQIDCIRKAHAFSKISSDSISYVEAHGTGTKLGDPIEVQALNRVFGDRDKEECYLGSVKSNIGHTGATAGIAGFIKTCLALHHGKIPASLHFNEPNPEVPFSEGPMKVCDSTIDWITKNNEKRRAGVSSFGIGGTNAHAVLEEAPKREKKIENRPSVFAISGMSLSATMANKSNLSDYLETTTDVDLSDVSGTLTFGRKHFDYRAICVADSLEDASYKLRIKKCVKAQHSVQTIFMCSGQGSQYLNMGKGLYSEYAVYRDAIDKGIRYAEKYSKTNFRELLFNTDSDGSINELEYSLPLMFITEYAMAQLLDYVGIKPKVLIGHSSGEYVAACLAGVFTFEEGIRIIVERSRLMQSTQRGLMLSVPMPHEEVKGILSDKINLVAVNGPNNCVLGGKKEDIEQLKFKLQGLNYDCKIVKSSHAAHSYLMEEITKEFGAFMSQFELKSPNITVISNVTGSKVSDELTSPEYWCKHLTSSVQFYQGINTVINTGNNAMIEIGPGQTLVNFVRQISDSSNNLGFCTIRHPKNEIEDSVYFLEAIAEMWEFGIDVDFSGIIGKDYRKVALPGYEFDKIKYPVEADLSHLTKNLGASEEEIQKSSIYGENWEIIFDTLPSQELDWLLLCGSKDQVELFESKLDSRSEVIKLIDDASGNFGVDFRNFEAVAAMVNKASINGIGKIVYFHCKNDLDSMSSGDFFRYTNVVKAIEQRENKEKTPFITIVENAYDVLGDEEINPISGLLIGSFNVLKKECVNLEMSLIELDSIAKSFKSMQELVFAEWSGFRVLRNNKPWQRTIQNIAHHTKETLPYKKGGLALITGTGGMATVLAEYLGKVHQMKIAFIGRSEINQDIQQDLRDNHIEYHFYKTDISDEEGVQKSLELVQLELGNTIDFVFHTTGLGDYSGILMGRSDADSSEILAPKVKGTVLLNKHLKHFNVQCIVFCSSRSVEIAPLGQIAYVAGNEFQNTYAKGQKNTKVVSIAWEAWKERGMGIKSVEKSGKSLDHLDNALTNEEAIDALNKILESGLRYAIVSKQNLHQLITEYNKELSSENEAIESSDVKVQVSRVGLKFDYVKPQNSIEKKVQTIWEDFFGYEGIGMEDDFFELGGDSLKLMRIHRILCSELEIKFELVELFTHFKIRSLVDFLIQSGLVQVEQQKKELETIKF